MKKKILGGVGSWLHVKNIINVLLLLTLRHYRSLELFTLKNKQLNNNNLINNKTMNKYTFEELVNDSGINVTDQNLIKLLQPIANKLLLLGKPSERISEYG